MELFHLFSEGPLGLNLKEKCYVKTTSRQHQGYKMSI